MPTISTDFAPGEKVYIPDIEQTATVQSIRVDAGGVSYECGWWHNGERRTTFLLPNEITRPPAR
jgi:hypothetical protein